MLTLRIPVAERAKPRKVEIQAADGQNQQIEAKPAEAEGDGDRQPAEATNTEEPVPA